MTATSKSAAATTPEAPPVPLAERLRANPDGILEQIAREHGTTTFEVVKALPGAHRTLVAPTHFVAILDRIRTWGDILFIVHTADVVLECKGSLPPGSFGRGYYNLHGESPIGGHLKADNCTSIAFVTRPFMGRASCSVQFFNAGGEAMFKIFVGRDAARELVADQVVAFEALRAELGSA